MQNAYRKKWKGGVEVCVQIKIMRVGGGGREIELSAAADEAVTSTKPRRIRAEAQCRSCHSLPQPRPLHVHGIRGEKMSYPLLYPPPMTKLTVSLSKAIFNIYAHTIFRNASP